MELRLLTQADAEVSTRMSHHAFGRPAGGAVPFTLGNGLQRWGMFDGATLAAKANDRAYHCLIGGRRVATAGVAGVAVAPEYRGTGLARQVMTHLLSAARARGAAISTLFRTAPELYRSLGYEQVAELTDATLPTSALRGIRPTVTTLRRAGHPDAPAIRQVYAAIAQAGSLMLTRDGAFRDSDEELLASSDATTLAVDPVGEVVGYVSWNRGSGYGPQACLSVVELLALTGDSYRALLAAVASFEAVTPTVRFRTSGTDPIHWLLPGTGWTVSEVSPYLLRVIDLAAAITARGWPGGVTGELVIELEDPVCPWNSGRHLLSVHQGIGRIDGVPPSRTEAGPVTTLAPGGLAVLYAGGVQVSALRRAGLISGGSSTADAVLDRVFAGPRPAILDYF